MFFFLLACTHPQSNDTSSAISDWLGLIITPEETVLPVGHSVQLSAIGLTKNRDTVDLTESVEWMVEDYSVLEISENLDSEGLLTALEPGNSRIYALYEDLKSPFAQFIVTDAELEQIDIEPSDIILQEGEQLQLQAIGTFSDGSRGNMTSQVRWITGNSTILRFPAAGIATGITAGETTVHVALDRMESQPVSARVSPLNSNGKPDLVIQEIQSTAFGAQVTIINQGQAIASDFWVDAYVGGNEPSIGNIGDGFVWIEQLNPNYAMVIDIDVSLQGSGYYWIFVDSNNDVVESHENNNIQKEQY